MLIGAVVRDFSDPFFAGAIEALAVEAMARGYNVVLGHAQGRLDEEIALTAVLETRHTRRDRPARRHAGPAPAAGRPADLAGPGRRALAGLQPARVPDRRPDDRAGIIAGLTTSRTSAIERIAFVSAHLPGRLPEREDAYVEFMTDRFGAVPDGYLQLVPEHAGGRRGRPRASCSRSTTRRRPSCTSTDLVAIGRPPRRPQASARTSPSDLSVVGFDDILIAAHTVPALTTLRMPTTEMVRCAVAAAIALAGDPDAERTPRKRLFEPTLIVRESTAPPPALGARAQSRLGIQTRIASTVRLAQAWYGTAPRAMLRTVGRRRRNLQPQDVRAEVGADRRAPGARRRGSRTSSSSMPAGRSAVSMRVHERPALERDAAADRVDPRIRLGHPGGHRRGRA